MRCSLPLALSAPSAVPTMEQQMPTKAIITMNQRIDTVCVTSTPQQFFDGRTSPAAAAAAEAAMTQWSLWNWCSAPIVVGECMGCAGGTGGGPDGKNVEGGGRRWALQGKGETKTVSQSVSSTRQTVFDRTVAAGNISYP